MVVTILKGFGLIALAAAPFGFLLLMLAEVLTRKGRIPTYQVTSVHPIRGGPPIKRAEHPIKYAA